MENIKTTKQISTHEKCIKLHKKKIKQETAKILPNLEFIGILEKEISFFEENIEKLKGKLGNE